MNKGKWRWVWCAGLLVMMLGWAACGTNGPGASTPPNAGSSKLPELLSNPMSVLLLLAAALGVVVFIERYVHYHRVQINTTEFIGGLRNVIRQKNLVEAISICEATPSPAARLVREAVLQRERGRAELKEILEQMGSTETARLERHLWVLVTLAQVAPLLGLLGTVMGFMAQDVVTDLRAHFSQALVPAALGLAVGVPCFAGYNYLVNEVGGLVLDMERSSMDALQLVGEVRTAQPAEKASA